MKTVVLAGALAVSMACAATTHAADQELLDKIKALEKRVAELEGKAPPAMPSKTAAFLSQTELSGYISASFFHNASDGDDIAGGSQLTGYHDEFTFHKLKLALDKPVAATGEKWDVGYSAAVILGQDAGYFGFTGLTLGGSGFIEKAHLTVNVPVGNGLIVNLGRMVTLMGVEVVEETINPNWSLGNQFVYVEPTTHLGAHFFYKFSDLVSADLAIFNGWDVVASDNNALTFMGRVTLTPCSETSVALLGYGGAEGAGNTDEYRTGAEIILTQKLGPKFTTFVQLDYGHEDFSRLGNANAEWFAGGVWLVYAMNDKLSLAVRGDYLKDVDSSRVGAGVPTPGNDTELTSLTLSLSWTPVAGLLIRPELRYDHSTESTFNMDNDQFIAGVGAAYSF